MSLKKASGKCRASYILLIIILVVIVIILSMIYQLYAHLAEISEYRGREAATGIITSAVDRTISRCDTTELYTLTTDDSGKVLSAQLDANAANRVKNILIEETEKGLEELGEKGISIPVGTLLGIPFVSGRGAEIDLGVQQLGAVKSELTSHFESAGINQTRLTIYVNVTVEIRAILPDGHTDITVTEEHIISDSLIVGDIPQAYIAK